MTEAQVRAERHSCEEENRQGPEVPSTCEVNLCRCQECLLGTLRQDTSEEKVPRWEAAVAGNSALGSKDGIDRRP